MGSTVGQKAIVITSLVVYIILVVFSYFSGSRSDSYVFKNLYNNRTIGDLSDIFSVNITPAGYAFTIWGVIYFWQFAWLLYSLSTIIRKSAPIVLPYSFHAAFIVTCILQFTWGIVWTHMEATGSFIVLASDWIAAVVTLAISCIAVERHLGNLQTNRIDHICLRLLVQNGLSILTSWTTVATCLNLSVMLVYSSGLSQTTACCIALSVLTIISLIYYVIENFIYPHVFKTTFIPWLVLVWALIASLVKNYDSDNPEPIFTVVLLVLTCILIIIRIILLIIRPSRGNSWHGLLV